MGSHPAALAYSGIPAQESRYNGFQLRRSSLPSARSHAQMARKEIVVAETIDTAKTLQLFETKQVKKNFLRTLVLSCTVLGTSVETNAKTFQNIGSTGGTDGGTTDADPIQVVKKSNDDREYEAFTLSNGLRVCVISDSKSSRAAAAMDVHVGSFSDPETIPGLAHFCEHMSFLGTEKYPNEEEFSSFLSTHGGSSNAYTDNEDTVYYFDVNSLQLGEALDRFGQFFAAPLFTPAATSRELNAIESEHAKNINNDGFRLYQLEKDGANPSHPFNNFATGNKYTLEQQPIQQGLNNRELLLDFHRRYYSAGLMTLTVLGKQSTSQLKRIVRKAFESIPTNNQSDPALQWWGRIRPFIPHGSDGAVAYEVVPVANSRSLSITWPVWIQSQSQRQRLQLTKPEFVLSHLLGHEGAGSLRSYLVKKDWINSLSAFVGADISDMQIFDVSIDLTENGFKNRFEIVKLVFAYMDLLRQEAPVLPQYILDELKTLAHVSFEYSEKQDPSTYVTSVATNMQSYPNPREYLTGPQLFEHADRSDIIQYLHELTPRNAKLIISAPEFKGKTHQVGRFYGTEFNNITLASETKTWEKVAAKDYSELALPKPNKLLPENFELISQRDPTKFSEAERRKILRTPPNLIRQDECWEVWHKLDDVFQQPKVYVVISLAIPASLYDVDFVIQSKLFVNCFLDSINEFLYDARLGGLGFEIEFTSKGVQFVLSGYSDKMNLFTKDVMNALQKFQPSAREFDRFRDLIVREYQNWATQQPYYHSSYYAAIVSETLQFPISALQKAAESCNIQQLSNFLSKLVKQSYGKAMILGNVDEQGAIELTRIVQDTFPFTPLASSLRSGRRVSILPKSATTSSRIDDDGASNSGTAGDGYRISRKEPNLNDDNSACSFYFQLPSVLPEDYMYVELLADIIEQPFYNSLRTQQQLGYIVYSGVKVREGVRYLTFVAQSSIVDGEELTRRIESFLTQELPGIVDSLSQASLSAFKQGIITRKLEPDQRLTSQAGRFWSEIIVPSAVPTSNNTSSPLGRDKFAVSPLFNRAEREVQAVEAMSLKAVQKFTTDFLASAGAERRLLVSQVTASKGRTPSKSTGTSNGDNPEKGNAESMFSTEKQNAYIEIDDEIDFRESLAFMPITRQQ